MAKRKRLSAANPMFLDGTDRPETSPAPSSSTSSMRAPIADVASDTAATAALTEVTEELSRARKTGRMVVQLPLDAIDQTYLVRDRLVVDAVHGPAVRGGATR